MRIDIRSLIVLLTTATVHTLAIAAPDNHAGKTATPVLEEVVVTAQKREESLQKTPISLMAFDDTALRRSGITDIADLRAKVPNMELAPFSLSQTSLRLYIRGVGIGDVQITQDPTVGVYQDGVYIARSSGLSMNFPDLERIEILRGPQGTLYGRNTVGGAINIISKKPDPSGFNARIEAGFGNFDHRDYFGNVNVPIGDKLAVRVGYLTSKTDGPVRNTGAGPDFGSRDRHAGRFALRWLPIENLTIDYSFDYAKIKDTSLFYQGTIPSTAIPPVAAAIHYSTNRFSRASQYKPVQPNDSEVKGHAINIAWDLGWGTVKSITGYRELDETILQDFSAGYPFLTLFASNTTTHQHQVSQEFQLLGELLDRRLSYILGLYYFAEHAQSGSVATIFGNNLTNSQATADNTSYAIYGQFTWTPDFASQRLHLTFGGRFSRDKRSATLDSVDLTVPSIFSASGSKNFSKFNPSFIAAYDIGAAANIYGKVSSGYKTGGFNVRAPSAASFSQGFDEENLITWEAGLKSEFFNRRLRFNSAVFYSNFKDIQLNVSLPGQTNAALTNTLNAGKARIGGVEVELTAALTEGLVASMQYGYTDAKYEQVKDPILGDIANQFQFVSTPKNSFALSLDYDLPSTAIGEFSTHLGYAWKDNMVINARVANQAGSSLGSYGLLDARLTWVSVPVGQSRSHFEVALWGRNLTDEEYGVDAVASFGSLHAAGLEAFGWPRTVGVDISWKYR